MGITRHRGVAFTAGILICLLVFEVTLRIVGSVYAHLSELDKEPSGTTKGIILCIGDSVTFGIGAPRNLSYPKQLETMLNGSEEEAKYTVINRGRPGQNSAQLLMRLEGYLQEFKPNIVTILIGAQNQANFYGYRKYLENSRNQKNRFPSSVHETLDRIRIYKFFRLLFKNNLKTVEPDTDAISIQHRNALEFDEFQDQPKPVPTSPLTEMKYDITSDCLTGETYKGKGDYDKALAFLLGIVETKEVEGSCYHVIGSIYRERKQYDQAVTWFKKGIEQDPTQFNNYEGVGWSYYDQKQYKEAIFWFQKGFEHAKYDTLYELCYVGIAVSFEESRDFQGAVEFFKKETERKPLLDDYLHTLANDYLMMFKKNIPDSEVHQWIRADIKQILELCARYNAKAILQNYPFEPAIDFIYKEVAERRMIPFIDHQTAFEKFIKDGVLNREYFVPDGHPNARGYHLMAKNIWMVLKDNVL